jgi:hypothetical protein
MPTVAMRAVRGRRRFANNAKVKRYLGNVVDDEVKPHFIQRFKMVVANWKHQVDFQARKFFRPDEIRLNVFPAGENKQIWIWVSGGTKGPYPIPKAGPGFLAFKTGYKPKTKSPGKFGGPGIFTGSTVKGVMQVQHPGIEAREFERIIREDEESWYNRTMENAWRRAIRSL